MKPFRKTSGLFLPSVVGELKAYAHTITRSGVWEKVADGEKSIQTIFGCRQEIVGSLLDVLEGVNALKECYEKAAAGELSDFVLHQEAAEVSTEDANDPQADEEQEDAGEEAQRNSTLKIQAEFVAEALNAYAKKHFNKHSDQNEARFAEKGALQGAIFACRPRDHVLLEIAEQVSVASVKTAACNLKKTRDKLVTGSLGLAMKLAGQHLGKHMNPSDLMQFAFMALIDAIDRHNGRLKGVFISLSGWRMVHEVQRASKNGAAIPLKKHVIQKLKKMRKQADLFRQTENRAPSDEELAKACGYSVAVIKEVRDVAGGEVSLDAPLRSKKTGEATETTVKDRLADPHAVDPVALIDSYREVSLLCMALKSLKVLDLKVLCARHELFGAEYKTQQQLAAEMGVTVPAIWQREVRARKALIRHLAQLKKGEPPIA